MMLKEHARKKEVLLSWFDTFIQDTQYHTDTFTPKSIHRCDLWRNESREVDVDECFALPTRDFAQCSDYNDCKDNTHGRG